jgi:catechol 2,3-dioxygenase-like lactoylglutathione lyase family enzyme
MTARTTPGTGSTTELDATTSTAIESGTGSTSDCPLHVRAIAISLNVPEPAASAQFLREHFGFTTAMEADGFVSLQHPDGGPNVIFLRTGLETFKPADRSGSAGDGLLLVFEVGDLDLQHERLVAEGVPVVTPTETEPWGERYVQYRDPNGLIIQLVQWMS